MARTPGPAFVTRDQAAQAQASAAPAWTPPAGSIPAVLIHLTTLAPALDGIDLSDDRRWRWLSWVTPAQVLRMVLLRLQRRADQIALRVIDSLDGVEVHDTSGVGSGGPEGPTSAAQIKDCERLLAILFDVPAAALRLAWAALLPSAEFERHALEGATVLSLKPKEAA